MAKNERTSEEVASIASKILKMKNPKLISDDLWDEIQSVAASALTQTPDKPKLLPLHDQYNKFKGLGKFVANKSFDLRPDVFLNLTDLKKI